MSEGISAGGEHATKSAAILPECVEIETAPNPVNAIIWLHGLGADGHDFEPVVPMLGLDKLAPTRVIFPHAPIRPVSVNGGMSMRAWYDILALEINRDQDHEGIRQSSSIVEALIDRERQRGVASERIVLAGFSQGGAMAAYAGLRYPHRLAGLILLSCYMLLGDDLADERQAANESTPVFVGHGSVDPVVPVALGRSLADTLKQLNMPVEYHEYPMPHSVAAEEIDDIAAWLARHLGNTGA